VIPVITDKTGTTSKPFRKYLNNKGKARQKVTTENSHIRHCTRGTKYSTWKNGALLDYYVVNSDN
jgi:hypothetical protein